MVAVGFGKNVRKLVKLVMLHGEEVHNWLRNISNSGLEFGLPFES